MSNDHSEESARALPHSAITRRVIGAFYDTYNALGFGFLEAVYRRAMKINLVQAGIAVVEEAPVVAMHRGQEVGMFRLDLLVEDRVAVELKAGMHLDPTAERQLMNYLRATSLDVGLLLYFGPRPSFRRVVSPRLLGARRRGEIRPDPPSSG